MTEHFGKRLTGAIAEKGPLCVGIDPHPALLHQWDLPDSAQGVAEFVKPCVDAFAGRVSVVKPQSAFFERHGSAGIAVLEKTMTQFRDAGTLVVLDAKRGDLGTTMTAYADAYLRSNSPLAADALTVQPYMGFGSLQPAITVAAENNTGLFVLALTSNPEGAQVQHSCDADGVTVAARIVSELNAANAEFDGEVGPFGCVIGATVGDSPSEVGIDLEKFHGPLLAPGFGAQGAGVEEIEDLFRCCRDRLIVNSSRGVLAHGPDADKLWAAAHRVNSLLSATTNAAS